MRDAFLRDRSANFWAGFAVFLLVAVPIGLFALVFYYLRRTAPGGQVEGGAVTSFEPEPEVEGPASRVAGAKQCPRCGVSVKPYQGRGRNECPNCGSRIP